MAKWGEFDFRKWERFPANLKEMRAGMPRFMEKNIRDLANSLLKRAVHLTPKGEADVRKGWKLGKISWNDKDCEVQVTNAAGGEQILSLSAKQIKQEMIPSMKSKLYTVIKKGAR